MQSQLNTKEIRDRVLRQHNQRGQGELFSRHIAPTGFCENIAGKSLTPKMFLEILIQAVQGAVTVIVLKSFHAFRPLRSFEVN